MVELHQHKKALGTTKIQPGSKHHKAAQEPAWYNTPVDLTHNLYSVGSTDEQSRQQRETSTG